MNILKKRSGYLDVARSGHKFVGCGFVLQIGDPLEGADRSGPAFGFTVTKKVGNAVERNRIKRRLRALAREHLEKTLPANRNYVLIGRRAALRCSHETLVRDAHRALQSRDLA